MKKTFVFIGILAITACSSAQGNTDSKNGKIPAAVKEAFAKKYPDVTDLDWDVEGENFEAEFEIGHKDYSAVFDASGKIIEEEMEIEVSALPQAATDYINKHYTNERIKEATQITSANGTVEYEAEIRGVDLIFDANGLFIR